jgi:hypothetical protein
MINLSRERPLLRHRCVHESGWQVRFCQNKTHTSFPETLISCSPIAFSSNAQHIVIPLNLLMAKGKDTRQVFSVFNRYLPFLSPVLQSLPDGVIASVGFNKVTLRFLDGRVDEEGILVEQLDRLGEAMDAAVQQNFCLVLHVKDENFHELLEDFIDRGELLCRMRRVGMGISLSLG